MNFFEWDESLDVKVEKMNDQHKDLIELMNLLEQQYRTKERVELQRTTFDKLYNYTLKHFRDEEELLKKTGYPGLPSHALIHQKLVRRLEDYKQQLNVTRGSLDNDFFTFLQMWLKSHIKGIDTKYSNHVMDCYVS